MIVEYNVLGPLEVLHDGVVVPLPSGRARVLMASLLLRANQEIPVDELVDRLWDGDPPNPARIRSTLQMVVSRLRQALGEADCVRTSAGGYLADIAHDSLDLARFRALAASGKPAESLALWRGPVLSNVASDSLHRDEVPALLEERLEVLERRIDADLASGGSTGLVAELRALTVKHPLRERFWAQLVLALHHADQQADALAAYNTVRTLLADELGVDPGPRLREAHRKVLLGESAFVAPEEARRPKPPAPRQLPADLGTFSGRHDELGVLDGLLPGDSAATRTFVVSALAGTGGVGKTALAVHWAHRVSDRFPDGQLFVNLRGYDTEKSLTSEQAMALLLAGLGVEPSRMPQEFDEQIGLYRSLLADRRVLVVLDNAATAEQVRPLLPASPWCRVLVTSRSDLRGLAALDDAALLRLDVLHAEDAHKLLRRVLAGTAISDDAVAELARLCGYLPLALRIAAANVVGGSQSSVDSYLAALRDGDRLGELAIGSDRRSAVRRTFQLSYQALAEEPRRLFRLLGLVPGPDFAPPVVAALAGTTRTEAERQLKHLTEVHLLEERHPGRYSFHDLLRLHAKDRVVLDEAETDRIRAFTRSLDFYLHSAHQADLVIRPIRTVVDLPDPGPGVQPVMFTEYGEAISWCAAERANLVAAIQSASANGALEHTWKLPVVLWGYFNLRMDLAEWDSVTEIALDAARKLGDEYAEAISLYTLGSNRKTRQRFEEAMEFFEAVLRIREKVGHFHGIAVTLDAMGTTSAYLGRFDEAVRFHRRSLETKGVEHGSVSWAMKINNLAFTLLKKGDLAEAHDLCLQALEVCEQHRAYPTMMPIKGTLVDIRLALHQYDDALRTCREMLAMPADHRDSRTHLTLLISTGKAMVHVGDIGGARVMWQNALDVAERDGDPRAANLREELAALGDSAGVRR